MERLRFKECENCMDWTGCITDCINDCGKPLDAMEEFNRYKTLEEQNRLLKLPCKVGDTVYKVHRGIELVYECKVVGIKQEHNTFSVKLHANINEKTYAIWVDDWFDECQIGHGFFLTQEAAEAALQNIGKDE